MSTTAETVCPHCQARNRRPKCGSCHEDLPTISDPPLVSWARKIHENQWNALRWLLLGSAAAVAIFLAGKPWESKSLTECQDDAARSGRSREAMHVLLNLCDEKFPVR